MKRRNYQVEEPEVFSEEEAKLFAHEIAQAEEDFEEEQSLRVNFRWKKPQLAVVMQAADAIGVTYQTYIKQTVFRQAVQDIQASSAAYKTVQSVNQAKPAKKRAKI